MAKLQIGSFQSFKICGAGCVEPERLPMSIQAPTQPIALYRKKFLFTEEIS